MPTVETCQRASLDCGARDAKPKPAQPRAGRRRRGPWFRCVRSALFWLNGESLGCANRLRRLRASRKSSISATTSAIRLDLVGASRTSPSRCPRFPTSTASCDIGDAIQVVVAMDPENTVCALDPVDRSALSSYLPMQSRRATIQQQLFEEEYCHDSTEVLSNKLAAIAAGLAVMSLLAVRRPVPTCHRHFLRRHQPEGAGQGPTYEPFMRKAAGIKIIPGEYNGEQAKVKAHGRSQATCQLGRRRTRIAGTWPAVARKVCTRSSTTARSANKKPISCRRRSMSAGIGFFVWSTDARLQRRHAENRRRPPWSRFLGCEEIPRQARHAQGRQVHAGVRA